MGIPHLITHLRAYAVAGDLTGKAVIIDGPSFAYQIFHICLAANFDARNPFEAAPSYALLGKTALQWLDALSARDVKISKIYFDGYLPLTKRSVREDRLKNYNKQLTTYREAFPQVIPPSIGSRSFSSAVDLFSPRPVPTGLTRLPAPPFLVPAIIESLSRSKSYRHMVEVVPGEAELFCAAYVKQNGGTIFTSDSDLLVHDIGDGSVSLFRDLSLVTTRGITSFRCVQYQLKMIAQRLKLPETHGIRSLAFEISLDVHLSFSQLLQRANGLESIRLHKGLYEEFCSQYNSLPMTQAMAVSGLEGSNFAILKNVLQQLDPRISEYVLQYPSLASVVGQEPTVSMSSREGIEMFMPFLLDCPTKTSAWEMSVATRQLAYGLLNLIVPINETVSTVIEKRRVTKSGTAGREWQLPTVAQMKEASEEMLHLIRLIRSTQPDLSTTRMWLAMTLHQDTSWGLATEKTTLGTTLIQRRDTPQRIHWNMVHFLAQIHGSYYSYRLLQQVLSIINTFSITKDLPAHVKSLHIEMQALPPLSELWSIRVFSQWLISEEASSMLESIHRLIGLDLTSAAAVTTTTKEEKKKRKRDNAVVVSTIDKVKRRPTNMFDLLDSEA